MNTLSSNASCTKLIKGPLSHVTKPKTKNSAPMMAIDMYLPGIFPTPEKRCGRKTDGCRRREAMCQGAVLVSADQ